MTRRWLGLALLLSLGVNLGIVAVLLIERSRPAAPSAASAGSAEAVGETPAEGLPGPPPGADEGSEPGSEQAPALGGIPRDGDLRLDDRPGPPPPAPPPRSEAPEGEDGAPDRAGDRRPPFPGAAEALERGELPPAVAWRLGALADRLGLTGDDRARFLEIQRRFFVESHQRRSRILGLQDRFRRSLGAADPSRETIDTLIRQLGEERAGFDRDLARTVLDTRALLGPGQERQYLEFLARLGPRPGGQGGPGGEGQPGPPPRPRPFRPRR